MSADRYYLAPDGNVVRCAQSAADDGHYEIGREVLAARGIKPNDYEDVYRHMFRLGFARIVVHDEVTVEVEHGPELTPAQKRFVQRLHERGGEINQLKSRFQ